MNQAALETFSTLGVGLLLVILRIMQRADFFR